MIDIETLTNKELEIMQLLWQSNTPLTSSELVDAAPADKTWKDVSIHIMLRSLLKKGAIVISGNKATPTNLAKLYNATITPEEYAAMQANQLDLDVADFFVAFMKDKKIDVQTKDKLEDMIQRLEKE